MSIPIGKRITILLPSGTTTDKWRKHLFVVMCEPTPQNEVLLVPIATFKAGYDKTCILQAGAHPFIKHTSYVDYKHAEQNLIMHLQKGISDRNYLLREPMKAPIFNEILDGFYQSKFTKPFVFGYLPKQN